MKILRSIVLTVGILIPALISSNSQCFGVTKNSMHSKVWSLVELSGEDIIPKDGTFTLSLNQLDNKFSGMAECNRYFGRFNIHKRKFSFEFVNSTRMMCSNQQLESKYFELLNRVDSYSQNGNTLRLKSKGKVILVFNVAPERPNICAQTLDT